MLNNLRDIRCPKNLYDLTRDYLHDRVTSIQINNYRVERTATKGCPQGSCCSPGLWNIMYNSLLNHSFPRHTKTIAMADEIVLLTTGHTPTDAAVHVKADLDNIEKRARDNKILFNDRKSKSIFITRKRKRN